MQYIYETESITFDIWFGGSKEDYLEIINERGSRGWRFLGFVPHHAKPKKIKGTELIFEKLVEE